jgi:replicative DNA helicase
MMIEEEILRLTGQLDPALNANGLATQAQVLAKEKALEAALFKIAKYPIEICDSSQVTIPFMLSECRRMKRRHGRLGMIIADYLQMIETSGKHSRRDLEVGDVSKGLKRIGNELGTAVLAVASLSRKCEERDNKRPIDIDLRDAGQIESDAHGLIFLYSEARYNAAAKEDDRVKNIVEVSISKNRGGDTGRTLLDYCGPRTSFSPVSTDDAKYYYDFISGKSFNGPSKAEAAKTNGDPAQRFPRKYATGSRKAGPPAADWGKQTSLPVAPPPTEEPPERSR